MENRASSNWQDGETAPAMGAKLDAMTERVTAAGAKARPTERKVVADLRAKQELAPAKLDELKAAGGDQWDTFKAGVESAYNELEATFKKLGN